MNGNHACRIAKLIFTCKIKRYLMEDDQFLFGIASGHGSD